MKHVYIIQVTSSGYSGKNKAKIYINSVKVILKSSHNIFWKEISEAHYQANKEKVRDLFTSPQSR